MLNVVNVLVILIFWQIGLFQNDLPKNKPLFLSLEKEFEQVALAKKVFTFSNPDTLMDHSLILLSDEQQKPLMFYADIFTPVCMHNECLPIKIELYWNLLGTYAGYGIFNEDVLTKYDHEAFKESDYKKLHALLSDKNSILKRKKKEELVVQDTTKASQANPENIGVDAISAATIKDIKASTVEGAIYSSHTIWHLANGAVNRQIQDYLHKLYTDSLELSFLYSEYKDYQLYALKQLKSAEFEDHLDQVIKIFKSAKPLTRTYILKKFPETLWPEKKVTSEMYQSFSLVDINSKTLLLKKLGQAHPIALEIISSQLEEMSKNQLKIYLKVLSSNKEAINPTIENNLIELSNSKTYTYSYLIEAFLAD